MYNQFNPYMAQQRYQPIEQMQQPQTMPQMANIMQNRPVLNGKVVESVEVAKNIDIPIDGSVSYFATADGSAIVTKQIQMDGTSKTIVYKPVNNLKEINKYLTIEEFNKEIEKLDFNEIEDLKDQIKDLKAEIKELKKKKKEE